MAKASREKGARGEREVAAIFRSHGFSCHRTPNSGGLMFKGDMVFTSRSHVPVDAAARELNNTPRIHCEVKRAERLAIPEWWRQTEAEAPADTMPVLAFRTNNQPWLAVVPLDTLARLLAKEDA